MVFRFTIRDALWAMLLFGFGLHSWIDRSQGADRERRLRELQTEGYQLIEAVQNALAQDGDLLAETERERIVDRVQVLQESLRQTDSAMLKRAITNLNDATVGFAQTRMDKSVSRALAGRNISDLEVKS